MRALTQKSCKCKEEWCLTCNPPDGPIPNDAAQSGLAQREKLGPDKGPVLRSKLPGVEDDVFDHDERNSGYSGPVF